MDVFYEETVDWASEMDRVRALLQLARSGFPAPSTLWRSFEWVPTRAWRQLLHRSVTVCDPGDHGTLEATFFDREAASSYNRDRSDRHKQTLKTTALVDAESCAVLDLHCLAHWPHDTQVGRRVALRYTDGIESLAGDKGYDDQSLRDALRLEGVRPLIKHRLFAHYDPAQRRYPPATIPPVGAGYRASSQNRVSLLTLQILTRGNR